MLDDYGIPHPERLDGGIVDAVKEPLDFVDAAVPPLPIVIGIPYTVTYTHSVPLPTNLLTSSRHILL